MEDNRDHEQNNPAFDGAVVFFSPEMLKLASERRRQAEDRLEECRRAAEEGDPGAQVQMGLGYLFGQGGMEKDPDKAFYWFSQAPADDPVGRYWLGVCCDNGLGTPRDRERAFRLFRQSAEAGYPPAMCDLGVCYENGQGTKQDLDKAAALYRATAQHGYPMGQCNLGVLYYSGVGLEKDPEQAARLFAQAAEQHLPRTCPIQEVHFSPSPRCFFL